MIDLLQIAETVNTLTQSRIAGDSNNDGKVSFIELFMMGGWPMIPLGIMFLIAVYIFVERYIAVRHASRIDENFMNIIRDHITSGNVVAARSFAKNTNNPVAHIIDKGIQRIGKPIESIEKSMDNVAELEMYNLEKNMGVLAVISKAAPIFGFVGTLLGLMQLFSSIYQAHEVEIGVISQGIYTKLICSITGLIIGLMAFLCYNYLNTQIGKATNRMEAAATDFLDVLQEPTR
jgi:biopolymer transport protein ExbB